MSASLPVVEIEGAARDWTTCLAIEESSGLQPSRALIHIGGGDYVVQGPITLNAYQWPFRPYSRVKITLDSQVLL